MVKYIKAKCPNNHAFKVPWNKEFAGKTLQKKCPMCDEFIKLKVPHSLTEGYTVVPAKNEKDAHGAKLIIQDSEFNKEQSFSITGKNNIVGRKNSTKSPTIEIETTDMRLSRLHFIIRVYDGQEDNRFRYTLSSPYKTNDIFLNDTLLSNEEEVYLANNDIIKTGMSTFTFKTII